MLFFWLFMLFLFFLFVFFLMFTPRTFFCGFFYTFTSTRTIFIFFRIFTLWMTSTFWFTIAFALTTATTSRTRTGKRSSSFFVLTLTTTSITFGFFVELLNILMIFVSITNQLLWIKQRWRLKMICSTINSILMITSTTIARPVTLTMIPIIVWILIFMILIFRIIIMINRIWK